MFTFAQRICVCALGAAGLYGRSMPTALLQETRAYAAVGLAEGQTGQVSVLNPGGAAPPGLVCSALLTLFDGQGKVWQTATIKYRPGASRWLAVDSDRDLALHVDERTQIRATFTIPPIPPPTAFTTPPPLPCALIGNLEIFDPLSGRTQVNPGVAHPVLGPVATPVVPLAGALFVEPLLLISLA
jgi:hypothetical protein